MYAPSQVWDLDVLFPGGPTGEAYARALDGFSAEIDGLRARIAAAGPVPMGLDTWRALLVELFDLQVRLGDLQSVAYCYNSANTSDEAGRRSLGRANDLHQRLDLVGVPVNAAIGACSEADLDALAVGALASWRPALGRVRAAERLRLEPALEALMTEADREALHGWGELYDLVTGSLTAPFEEGGDVRPVGIARLAALRAHPDADVRRRALAAKNGAFEGVGDICATILTHITGTRQMRLDRVGADELAHTLLDNRIDQEVLDAMWAGADRLKPTLTRYLDHKARLLGVEGQLDWCDVDAPVGTPPGGEDLSWEDAQGLVVDAFDAWGKPLASFSRGLLREGGVEAEARDHKRPGGYCCGFDTKRTSRIFMTFTGTVDNAITLAHELGHAWHGHLLFRAEPGARRITSGLAESASTFAESIVRDQILTQATDPGVRRFMLDQQLQAGVAFLMNIRARYGFERELYRMRRDGPFSPSQLTACMLEQQRLAYGDALASWDPMFWASKLHFYISHFGFYNWPYTFGYLFSSAIYARARAEGPGFLPVVEELLMRTGWQDCRPLARDVLGVDLGDPSFWEGAARPLEGMLAELEAIPR